MSNNKARTAKKKEWVEGPATIKDSFELYAVDMKQEFIALNKNEKVNAKNTKTLIPNKIKRSILSTELMAGMTIKAMPGTIKSSRTEVAR